MLILGIDPGNKETAYVVYDTASKQIAHKAKKLNDVVRIELPCIRCDRVVMEVVACYGMAVGQEVFDTVEWIGRYTEIVTRDMRMPLQRIKRTEVKMALCHQTKGVNDSVIRQRLIDLFGGKEAAIGKKANPGPLYGVTKDCWAALAVIIASGHQ